MPRCSRLPWLMPLLRSFGSVVDWVSINIPLLRNCAGTPAGVSRGEGLASRDTCAPRSISPVQGSSRDSTARGGARVASVPGRCSLHSPRGARSELHRVSPPPVPAPLFLCNHPVEQRQNFSGHRHRVHSNPTAPRRLSRQPRQRMRCGSAVALVRAGPSDARSGRRSLRDAARFA